LLIAPLDTKNIEHKVFCFKNQARFKMGLIQKMSLIFEPFRTKKKKRRRRRRRQHDDDLPLPTQKKQDKKKRKKKSHTSSRFHHFSDAHFDRRTTHTLNNKLTRVF